MSEFVLRSTEMNMDMMSLYGTKRVLYGIRADLAVQILWLRTSGNSSAVYALKNRLSRCSKRIGNEITNINSIVNTGNTICSKAKNAENSAKLEMSGLLDIARITWPFQGYNFTNIKADSKSSIYAGFLGAIGSGANIKNVTIGTVKTVNWIGKSMLNLYFGTRSVLDESIQDTIINIRQNGISSDSVEYFKDRVFRYIPKYLDDSTFVFLMQMGAMSKIDDETINNHYKNNKVKWEKVKKDALKNGYIENQDALNELYYGKHNSILEKKDLLGTDNFGGDPTCAYNSCEVNAVYNSMYDIEGSKMKYNYPELIKKFEESGVALDGYAGSSEAEMVSFLNEEGYNTTIVMGENLNQKSYNNLVNKYDNYIVTVYNNQYDVSKEVHTMSITKGENNKYYLHNAYNAGDPIEGNSIEDVINQYSDARDTRDAKIIDIIGVSKND